MSSYPPIFDEDALRARLAQPKRICTAPYFASGDYAADQRRWRSEQRFLTYCSSSPGLGAWLKGLVTAFVASILSERALVIGGCAIQFKIDTDQGDKVTTQLVNYFQGRGFDFTEPSSGHSNPPPKVIKIERRLRHTYNRSYVHGNGVGNHWVHLLANEHSGPDKIFTKSGEQARQFLRILQGEPEARTAKRRDDRTRVKQPSFDWDAAHFTMGKDPPSGSPKELAEKVYWYAHVCAYQQVLTPTPRLLKLERDFFEQNGVGVDSGGQPDYKVVHARLGDGEMQPSSAWRWFDEARPSFMRVDPESSLACFGKLGTGISLFITDSAHARECAKRNNILTTQGDAAHLGSRASFDRPTVDKLFLDWWLMSRARHAASLDCSSLITTARLYAGDAPEKFGYGCGAVSTQHIAKCNISQQVARG